MENQKTRTKNIWNKGDIGFALGCTKCKIILIRNKELRIEYLEKSYKYPIGHRAWMRRGFIHKKRRKGWEAR